MTLSRLRRQRAPAALDFANDTEWYKVRPLYFKIDPQMSPVEAHESLQPIRFERNHYAMRIVVCSESTALRFFLHGLILRVTISENEFD